jgi:hypothetical protein
MKLPLPHRCCHRQKPTRCSKKKRKRPMKSSMKNPMMSPTKSLMSLLMSPKQLPYPLLPTPCLRFCLQVRKCLP